MNCPQCGKENPESSRFCQFCGATMTSEITGTLTQPVARAPQPPLAPLSTAPPPGSGTGQIGQVGAGGTAAVNIWGPFAQYGGRGRHVSWLLDEQGTNAQKLHGAVTERFQQRQIPGSQMEWSTLVAKGLLVERRPFYFIKRGITTVALYIAQFGRDLYISQVTYVKGPFSNVRIAILALMILFFLYYSTFYSASLFGRLLEVNPFSRTSAFPFFLLCIVGPLGGCNSVLLFFAVLYSLYKWVTERDFLAILRTPPNEFQQDDTIALEKAVEETVRQALDTIGIDTALMPPAAEQSFGGRRRLI
ncbi:MAG: zinc-ribbon domain-containing protein [Anaerolineae bacterium]|nr:zinc-ribbon domain-containing protein [Anaerolineae bacterium]